MDQYNFFIQKEKKQSTENFYQNENLETIYRWLDVIPFSKAPKTLARDFADGVSMAELLKIYFPHYLEVNNITTATNINMRKDNWHTLNRKVFSKINLTLNNNTISQLANCQHGTIEKLLLALYGKITNEDINYLQEPVQELEVDDIIFLANESIEEPTVESLESESLETNSVNPATEWKMVNRIISLIEKLKNNLKVFMIWLMSVLCFWKYFSNYNAVNSENNEIVCNIYPLEIAEETAFINAQINESVTRWAYEQLIQEIREKEDIITILNHKIAYLEGTMRQKDLRITNLMTQITNNSVEILPNTKQRLFTGGPLRLRPKSYNPLMMPNSYGS